MVVNMYKHNIMGKVVIKLLQVQLHKPCYVGYSNSADNF